MSAPPQAQVALAWAIAGPPLVVFAATRVRAGRRALHAALMLASVGIELAVFVSFKFVMAPGDRRPILTALPFFKVHLACIGTPAPTWSSCGASRSSPGSTTTSFSTS